MGDPKKPKKKYIKPSHPWQKIRIEKERQLRQHYGTKTKKEIWKMDSVRKNFTDKIKTLIASSTEQARKEKDQITQRLIRLGLVNVDAKIDDILGMGLEDVMERRLQTLVWKQGLAKTIDQSRQLIVHRHITVAGKMIISPSYLVTKTEEPQIAFLSTSSFNDPDHPERMQKKKEPVPVRGTEEKKDMKKRETKATMGRHNRHQKQAEEPKKVEAVTGAG